MQSVLVADADRELRRTVAAWIEDGFSVHERQVQKTHWRRWKSLSTRSRCAMRALRDATVCGLRGDCANAVRIPR